MESLFPALPEDISAASDEELKTLISDHESARDLIADENEEFLKDLSADEILAELEKGGNQYQLLLAENELRARAHENYVDRKNESLKAFEPAEEGDPPSEPDPDGEGDGDGDGVTTDVPVEVVAEEEVEEVKEEERELVLASADPPQAPVPAPRYARTPPAPRPERLPVESKPE